MTADRDKEDAPRRPVRYAGLVVAMTLVAAAVVVGLGVRDAFEDRPVVTTSPAPAASSASPSASAPVRRGDPTYSNVYKYDYVGPMACRGCHTAIFERWNSHPHARMNQNASASTVVAAFDGRELRYGGASVIFDEIAGDYVMAIRRGDETVRRYRVTRTIGSRFIQMFVGLQLDGPEPREHAVYHHEAKLPFAYWIGRDEWFPQTYDETPGIPEYDESGRLTAFYDYTARRGTGEWKRSCALCHNTYPYAIRFDDVAQGKILGFPKADIQLVTRADTPRQAPVDERGSATLEPWQLITLGISCESCHFGGREHALDGAQISFLPRGEDIVFTPTSAGADRAEGGPLIDEPRQSPYVINSICAQCHSATTQGPSYPHGGSSWNSGEARDLGAGACTEAIKCTDCHDPHTAGPVAEGSAAPPRQLGACTACHEALAEPAAAAHHSRHDEGVTCLDCHMPRIVHGLDGMIRSHRISSPSHPEMLSGEWPNACNLCHLDRPLRWTLEQLAQGWQARVSIPAGSAVLDEPVGERWLAHPEGVVRQAAADAYARSGTEGALAKILPLLDDESPPTRLFARLAVERLLGRRLSHEEYRPWAPPAERRASIDELSELEPAQSK